MHRAEVGAIIGGDGGGGVCCGRTSISRSGHYGGSRGQRRERGGLHGALRGRSQAGAQLPRARCRARARAHAHAHATEAFALGRAPWPSQSEGQRAQEVLDLPLL